MQHKILHFILFLLSALPMQAQVVRELATDRPGLGSDAPITVPKGFLQLEAGFQMDKDRYRQGTIGVEETLWSYPSTLLRYGILDHWEFRLSFDALFLNREREGSSLAQQGQGLSPLTLGTKVMLTEEKSWLPYMSLQLGLTIPSTGAEVFQARYTQPSIVWLATKSITDKLSLTVNLGSSWEDDSPAATYNYAASFDLSLQDKLGAFLEFYGFWPEFGTNAHLMNYGLTYLILDDLQLDISSGFGLNEEATDYFVGLGISGRIGF